MQRLVKFAAAAGLVCRGRPLDRFESRDLRVIIGNDPGRMTGERPTWSRRDAARSSGMTLKTVLALAAAFVFAPLAAHAADYVIMGDDNRALGLIEAAVKTDSEGHKETVFFIAFSEPVEGSGGGQVVSSTILFDCAAKRYKVGPATTFTADMTALASGDGHFGWRDLVDGSPFSRAAGYACRGEVLPKASGLELKAIIADYLARQPPAEPSAPAAE